jgi:hypothetical protein
MSDVENDLRAIELVNQRDVQAALAGDTAMMMSQWTDDFVVLSPVGPIMRGRAAIVEAIAGRQSNGRSTLRKSKSSATTPCSGEPMVGWFGRVQAARRVTLAASCCAFFSVSPMGLGRCTARYIPLTRRQDSRLEKRGR